MIFIKKYIEANVRAMKVIPVDESEDINKILNDEKKLVYDHIDVPKNFDVVDISFNETKIIEEMTETFSKIIEDKYKENITYDDIVKEVYSVFDRKAVFTKYLLNEVIECLENKYDISLDKINI